MIDIISIKNRLSELAIHGELVDHTGTLADVEKIVTSIKRDRDSLVKEGLSKKSKESPMIEEGTFDVPDNWKWVALGDLCIFLSRGKSPKYSEIKKYPVFAQKCNQPDGLALWKAQFLDETTLEKWPEYFRLRDKDVVINSTGTGTMGRVGYYLQESLNSAYPFMLPDSHVTVARLGEGVISRYVYYAMRSPTLQMIMEKQFRGSTNQKEYYIDSVYATPIPLPPTDEQEKIVDQLEKIFELLNSIDDFQKQYTSNREALKSKLIEAAIQGKLTEQLSEDGTAEELYQYIQEKKNSLIISKRIKKDKSVLEVKEEEVPFDIPDNWKWVCWGEIVNIVSARRVHQSDWRKEGIPFYRAREIAKLADNGFVDNDLYISEELYDEFSKSGVPCDGDLMVSAVGTLGKTYVVKESDHFYYKDASVLCFENFAGVDPYYLRYVMNSDMMNKQIESNSGGTTVDTLTMVRMIKYLLPLPPLQEQHRIVEKIDSILSLIA